jgi:hypothetical protein
MIGFGTSPLELLASEAMLANLVYCDEFYYSAAWIGGTSTQMGALDTVEVQIQINADSDFIVQGYQLVAFSDADTIVDNPNFVLTLTRAGSGRQVMNQSQHVLALTGSGQNGRFPSRKGMPAIVQSNNALSCKLQNLSNTDYSGAGGRIDLTLEGFKVFYTTDPRTGQQGDRVKIFHVL